MKYRHSFLFLPIQLLSDFICLNVAFRLAYGYRFDGQAPTDDYLVLQGFCNLFWLLIAVVMRPYRYERVRFHVFSLVERYAALILVHASLVAFGWILLKDHNFSRLHLFYFYLIFSAAGSAWRTLAVIVLKFYRASGHNTRRFVIVGYGKLAMVIKKFYENHPEMGFQFYGFFDDPTPENKSLIRGDYERLETLLATGTIDCVYCCAPYIQTEALSKLVEKSPEKDYQIKLVIDFTGFLGRKSSIEYHDMIPIVSLSNQMWEDVKVKWLKRVFDVCFSLLVLLFGSPIFFIVAIVTKLTSAGGIFYAQDRIGKDGKAFKIYKFRSMYVDSEQQGPALSSGGCDARITPWGHFIRKSRLDELPQFYNVLIGEMSVVGPRPERQHFIDQIVQIAPNYTKLLQLKPGITSIGQVKYGYAQNVEEMTKRLRYDLIYLNRISLFVDMWLIMQTVLVMVKGKGK